MIIDKMPFDSFTWIRWRKGIFIWEEFGIACKKSDIYNSKHILCKFAIGYINSELLTCRAKKNEIAVMFLINNEFCWTHLRKDEFNYVFGR